MLGEAHAALERGRPVVLVTPPAPEQAANLWPLIGPGTVLVCANDAEAAEWAAAAPADRRVHAVTGLSRTTRTLKERPFDVLAGRADDLVALLSRSVLKLDTCSTVVVAWPERPGAEPSDALDTLLSAAANARRIILTSQPAALRDLLERHAHRAEIVGALPVTESGAPLHPVGPARYAIVPASHRAAALRDALDLLNPSNPLVWDGGIPDSSASHDVVFCLRLPTHAELATLSRIGPPVVFITGAQLSYLRSIASPLTALQLATAADRARDRAEALRAQLAALIEGGNLDAELALIDPLLERYDPAEVAAAALALRAGKVQESVEPVVAGWVKIFVNVGKKDRAAAKDLVGALVREVRLPKTDIGKIDVQERFSVVEVTPAVASQVVRDLTGVTIRGRRVAARLDRDA